MVLRKMAKANEIGIWEIVKICIAKRKQSVFHQNFKEGFAYAVLFVIKGNRLKMDLLSNIKTFCHLMGFL